MLTTNSHRITFLILLLCLSICLQGCERKLPVTDADRNLLLRAGDLSAYGYGFQPIDKYETFTKSKTIDGSYDLEYEFETPESEEQHPLFLYVLVSVGKEKVDARINQGTEKLTLLLGLKANGINEEEIPNFYRYGDASSFYVLKKDGVPIGNYFTVREGSKTYSMVISGMYFSDPELWKEIIEPKLKQFSLYRPN